MASSGGKEQELVKLHVSGRFRGFDFIFLGVQF